MNLIELKFTGLLTQTITTKLNEHVYNPALAKKKKNAIIHGKAAIWNKFVSKASV